MKTKLLLTFIFITGIAKAQWQQTNGPHNGDIRCMAASGTNIFAGTSDANKNLYFSPNNGSTWVETSNELPSNSLRSLVISGTNIFAENFGMFLSTNNVSSWTSISNGLPIFTFITSIAISGTSIFASTDGYGCTCIITYSITSPHGKMD